MAVLLSPSGTGAGLYFLVCTLYLEWFPGIYFIPVGTHHAPGLGCSSTPG